MIEKARPEHLRGYLVGVGGHVEPGEDVLQAVRREVEEESGAYIHRWRRVGVQRAKLGGDIAVFAALAPPNTVFGTKTDEAVVEVVPTFTETRPGTFIAEATSPVSGGRRIYALWPNITQWAVLANRSFECGDLL